MMTAMLEWDFGAAFHRYITCSKWGFSAKTNEKYGEGVSVVLERCYKRTGHHFKLKFEFQTASPIALRSHGSFQTMALQTVQMVKVE